MPHPSLAIFLFLGSFTTCALCAEGVELVAISSGAATEIQPPPPQKLNLVTTQPEAIREVPEGLTHAGYGHFSFGPAEHPAVVHVILDQPKRKTPRLFVDGNLNRNLTDDPAVAWQPFTQPGADGEAATHYKGFALVRLRVGNREVDSRIGFFYFDPTNTTPAPATMTAPGAESSKGGLKPSSPAPPKPKRSLLFFADYARKGSATIGGKSYPIVLTDDWVRGDFRGDQEKSESGVTLRVDRNADGRYERFGETFDVRRPFNLGGQVYEVSNLTAMGDRLEILPSAKKAAEIPLAPDLSARQKAPAFEAKLLDGHNVRFPRDFKGRVVLLDLWATWSGPCVAELPNIHAAHEKYHGQGLEVLGLCLDPAGQQEMIEEFLKKHHVTWPQVYAKAGWEAALGQHYGLEAIPRLLLVDGDSGVILATNKSLRGEQMMATLEKAFSQRVELLSAKP